MKRTEFQRLNDKTLTNKNAIRELRLKQKSLEMKFIALEKAHSALCNNIAEYFRAVQEEEIEEQTKFKNKLAKTIGFNYPGKSNIEEHGNIELKNLENPPNTEEDE